MTFQQFLDTAHAVATFGPPLLAVMLVAVFLHELAHAAAAARAGCHVLNVRLGRFGREIRVTQHLTVGTIPVMAEAVIDDEPPAGYLTWPELTHARRAFIAGAGPLANLALGVLALATYQVVFGRLPGLDQLLGSDQPVASTVLGWFAWGNLLMTVVDLVPLRIGGAGSDGARVLDAAKADPAVRRFL